MAARPAETSQVHTRLLKTTLEAENSRAYWRHRLDSPEPAAQQAFDEYWFGAKSLPRVRVLLTNLRARFEPFPDALALLGRWPHMGPGTRGLVCHWHLQLSDPLYRRFSGDYLVERRHGARPEITRDLIVAWVTDQGPGRWTMTTRIQLASKLMSCAHSAGLVGSTRDPRPLTLPRVRDEALAYLMYLLRGIDFDGSLLDNPYVHSVGLDGRFLEERLAKLPGLRFRRQGDLIDFGWAFPDLAAWGAALAGPPLQPLGASDEPTEVRP